MSIFESIESQVRSYCRDFPVTFDRAQGSLLYDENGREYLDFLAGAGALNYGHNNPKIIEPIIDYLKDGGILHGLDLSTTAKRDFLETFNELVLKPRNLSYKVMFTGPTGTNAVEAAIKLARKVTGRDQIFAFTGSFHGMTTGSLSVSSKKSIKENLGSAGNFSRFFPYSGGFYDAIEYLDQALEDDYSGLEIPAAIILETTQAEGGVNVAETEWLKRLRDLCDKYGILLIVDDIQVGIGRTGTFFSFERAGIEPDMITLSKSISGSGLPMALLLIKDEYDIYRPAEHNGTFRGNQLAFIGAAAALKLLKEDQILDQVAYKEKVINDFFEKELFPNYPKLEHRGIGLIHGIDFSAYKEADLVNKIVQKCFENGLVIENAGKGGNVLKILPALTIPEEQLNKGLEIIQRSVQEVMEAENLS